MSLQCCQRFANVEAQFGVQAHRAIVVSHLDKSDTESVSLGAALQNRCHQCATDLTVLPLRVHRHRTHAEDRSALIEEIASDYTSVGFGDDTEEAGMRHERGHEFGCHVYRREVGWKVVAPRDRLERLKADAPAFWDVGCGHGTDINIHQLPFFSVRRHIHRGCGRGCARSILKFHGGEAR